MEKRNIKVRTWYPLASPGGRRAGSVAVGALGAGVRVAAARVRRPLGRLPQQERELLALGHQARIHGRTHRGRSTGGGALARVDSGGHSVALLRGPIAAVVVVAWAAAAEGLRRSMSLAVRLGSRGLGQSE